jgi:hypothetical protein
MQHLLSNRLILLVLDKVTHHGRFDTSTTCRGAKSIKMIIYRAIQSLKLVFKTRKIGPVNIADIKTSLLLR